MSCLNAQVVISKEYQLKAAFVYNLARMVEWPEEAFKATDNELLICLLGEDNFGDTFDDIRHKQVRGHPIQVHYYDTLPDEEVFSHCHLLFIQRSESEHLVNHLSQLSPHPILTVSDIELFAERGGMVNLTTRHARIRLEINRNAAQQSGLHISARLLALARLVETLE